MSPLDITEFSDRAIRQELEQEEQNRARVERLTRYFSRVNSALTFREIKVTVESSHLQAPAWSSASDITLNSRLINDFNNGLSVANLRGLNFHELSHILYTPRMGSEIVTWVNENGYRRAFNALEDQRIETLFTSRFPSTVDWFVVTVLTYFVNDEQQFANSYPLLRGRRYLPLEVRSKSRELFIHKDKLDELCSIIDEYRTLIYPLDTERGKVLVERFHNLIDNLPQDESGESQSGEGAGSNEVVDYNDMADWEKELLENATPADGNSKNTKTVLNCPFGHDERPHEGLEPSVNSRPQPIKQQKRDSERAKQLDSASQDESHSDSESQSQSQSESPTGKFAGDTGSLTSILNTAITDVMDKHEVAQEIANIVRIMKGLPSLSSNNLEEPQLATYRNLNPDTKTLSASVSFARELERLKAKFDPAWDKYESRGKLNASRFMRGDDLDTVFDTWNEGREDVTEIEAVIILDNSGSMNGDKSTQSYRAMYAIKYAFDRIGAKCSVITFNHDTRVLYRSTDKATNSVRDCGSTGGTNAEYAVRYATKLLAESDKPVKLFFAITDGEWSDTKVCDEEIKKLSRAGVLTAFAYIPESHEQVELTYEKAHFSDVASVVRNPLDLVGMARTIVQNAIGRRLTNA
jgi:hypothetical protein